MIPSTDDQQRTLLQVLVAADSYKGSLSSREVIHAVEEAAARCKGIAVQGIAISDGGEGMLAAVLEALGGVRVPCTVMGPLGNNVEAAYGLVGDGTTAIVEMAQASGLTLLEPAQLNPLLATSYGLGELLCHALNRAEVTELIIGIGGSATNDGGMGMAQALGIRALDANGEQVAKGGLYLNEIVTLDTEQMHPRLRDVTLRVMCDVRNPLYGPQGASAIYGPQKGANEQMVATLDANLRHLANLFRLHAGRDIAHLPGAGAAGGVGAALIAFCGATLQSGVDVMLDLFQFDTRLRSVHVVITGEGRTDEQTAFGKVVAGVAKRAKLQNKPVICLSGALGAGTSALYDLGVTSVFSICPKPMTEQEAMRDAYSLLMDAAENVLRLAKSMYGSKY